MFNPQYLGNVGDKKWSPIFDSSVRGSTFGQLLPSKIDWPRTFKVARADLWVYNALLSHFLTEFRHAMVKSWRGKSKLVLFGVPTAYQ